MTIMEVSQIYLDEKLELHDKSFLFRRLCWAEDNLYLYFNNWNTFYIYKEHDNPNTKGEGPCNFLGPLEFSALDWEVHYKPYNNIQFNEKLNKVVES